MSFIRTNNGLRGLRRLRSSDSKGLHSAGCLRQKEADDELQRQLAELYDSPVFKQAHKWDGSTKKLSQSSIPKKFDLKNNTFARLLSSPARQDRTSKLVLPRDVMLRFSIAKDVEDGSLWLVPNMDNTYMYSESSYFALDRGLVKSQFIKKPNYFAPIELLTSVTKVTRANELKSNKTTDLVINRELIMYLQEKLLDIEFKGDIQMESNDLVIHLTNEVQNGLQIDLNGVIHLSPSAFDIPSPNYNEFIEHLKTHANKDGHVIIKATNNEFIDIFMRLVLYNK